MLRLLKHTCYLIAFLLMGTGVVAQVSLGTEPVSWGVDEELLSSLNYEQLEDIDAAALMAEDAAEVIDKDLPIRFAVKQEVEFTTNVSGRWVNLDNGDRIWMLGIYSPNAKALSVTFETFDIPKGAVVHIYNANKEEVIGAFTADNNKTDGVLTTSSLTGEQIVVEYYEPYAVRQEGYLNIRTVAHTYREVDSELNDNTSLGECMVNVDCEVDEARQEQAASTVLITVDDGTRWCTGTLVNNANFDGTPYILTGDHCLYGDPSSWLFTFNYQARECDNSGAKQITQSISGAQVVTSNVEAGVALLELSARPKPEWNVFYAGWDASGVTPQGVHSIHHPLGDVKKISLSVEAPLPEVWKAKEVFTVENWLYGATSNGSTGAPLFDQNGRVIGVMFGGTSSCQFLGDDHFNKIAGAWDDIEKYLNPFNQDIITLDGTFLRFGVVDVRIFNENIALFPNPATTQFNLVNDGASAIVNVEIHDMSGRLIDTIQYTGQPIDVSTLPVGHYVILINKTQGTARQKLVIWR
ncbi:T9SS type A sorting domain-containing protein [Sanyastnella coralliicola]|uniref:T9SS type A sorting domain-containing protein n=1 Tax=Sanyastnella coralliicola TaxID=3069118 RepID=UPI0027BAA2CF|nr:T9SS type A sorting domain-containing protein [Longitalea sp. SCSIO 12813]